MSEKVTFITGNQKKAEYLSRFLGYEVHHKKVDLDEIQSLDLSEIVTHKVKQAYKIVKSPVIVEDVALEFGALGRLPGPYIKWFLEEMSEEDICNLVNGKDRTATAKCVFGYYDGEELSLFEGDLSGRVAEAPAGDGGYGWDRIFIPDGYEETRAELSAQDDEKTYLQIKPFAKLKLFLEHRQS